MPSFPSDVTLPINAKYYSFVENSKEYNPQYDVTWSFDFALSAANINTQCAFSTFIVPTTTLLSSAPGHYIGVPGEIIYLLTESGEQILTESGEPIIFENNLSGAVISVAFDTTGLFALSSSALYERPGVGISSIKRNALIIRDNNQNVLFNQSLSAFSDMFMLTSVKAYQTLRFRYANAGRKFSIDYRPTNTTQYSLLTSINLPTTVSIDSAYIGFAYTTPVSSTSTAVADMYLKNFHIDGNTAATTYENIEVPTLSSAYLDTYTVLPALNITKR